MTPHNPPAPDVLTATDRLVRGGVTAFRQSQFWGWWGMLRSGERADLYEWAILNQVTQERAPGRIVFEALARLSEEEIP